MDTQLIAAVRQLVMDLVAQRYGHIVNNGQNGRLTEVELRTAIAQYGSTLAPLPDEAWSLIEVFPHTASSKHLSLDVPLWTVEEGRSDLTLSLTATRRGDNYEVEIDDLHVL